MRTMKRRILIILSVLSMFLLSSCGYFSKEKGPLDPEDPITITLWHYYNGHIKEQFDELVSQFNETEGVEKGVIVEAQSLGDVAQLADAVFNAANEKIGSEALPDLFMAYPDNAFRVSQIVELVDLETILSKEELGLYREDFLEEGRIGEERKLLIMPIAKSTENLYLNKTFWDEFASESGVTLEQLSTWEGVLEVAKIYYEYTGKAFLGIDAVANYMQVVSMQLGQEIYDYDGDHGSLSLDPDIAKKIWDCFYIPYIKGYFEKNGRFTSDDAKIGRVIAYTGSTAGAAYFPIEVTLEENEILPIEPYTLPYPYFEEGKKVAILQGAGMCITKSDAKREYASGLFLKWFTGAQQNLEFTVTTGYFPVTKQALQTEVLLTQVEQSDVVGAAIPMMIRSTGIMLQDYFLYSSKPFVGSYELRMLIESNLFDKVTKDIASLEKRVEMGEDRIQVIHEMIRDEEFNQWFEQFKLEAGKIANE